MRSQTIKDLKGLNKFFSGESTALRKEAETVTGVNKQRKMNGPKIYSPSYNIPDSTLPEFIKRRNERSKQIRMKQRSEEADLYKFALLVHKANQEKKKQKQEPKRGFFYYFFN